MKYMEIRQTEHVKFHRLGFAFVYTLKSSPLPRQRTYTPPSKCPYTHLKSLSPVPLHSIPCQPKATADLLSTNINFHSLEFYIRGIMHCILGFVWVFIQHNYFDIHPYDYQYQQFIFFHCLIFYCMAIQVSLSSTY